MQGPMIVLIFCSILFLYIHIYFHLKTSDDLEVYEIDKPSKDIPIRRKTEPKIAETDSENPNFT